MPSLKKYLFRPPTILKLDSYCYLLFLPGLVYCNPLPEGVVYPCSVYLALPGEHFTSNWVKIKHKTKMKGNNSSLLMQAALKL